jgi:siroheme synthase (precorrin-2 oxidase/ferrochelatase)
VCYLSAKSYTMYFDVTVEDKPCAIIGAGVVGVSTALELIKRGRKVTVYSAAIPDMEPKEGMEIPSQELPTVWMPKEYDYS